MLVGEGGNWGSSLESLCSMFEWLMPQLASIQINKDFVSLKFCCAEKLYVLQEMRRVDSNPKKGNVLT